MPAKTAVEFHVHESLLGGWCGRSSDGDRIPVYDLSIKMGAVLGGACAVTEARSAVIAGTRVDITQSISHVLYAFIASGIAIRRNRCVPACDSLLQSGIECRQDSRCARRAAIVH